MQAPPLGRSLGLAGALAALSLPVEARAQASCQLDHPIVLSHHWGARKICPDNVAPEDCEAREPAKYCSDWIFDWSEWDYDCAEWSVPPDERWLPPRNTNVVDPSLTRDMSRYHRYYSQAIVERLEACGNAVYLSDKPPFASYAVRARSLRETVLQALSETGADRVNILGMSQGSQDARYMAAELPVDDTDPSSGMMRDKVASIVTIVGEDQGAESASLLLDGLYVTNYVFGSGWGDHAADPAWTEAAMNEVLWEDSDAPGTQHVLIEGYEPSDRREYDLSTDDKYRSYLASITVLTRKYMQGQAFSGVDFDQGQSWDDLRSYLGLAESGWDDLVAVDDEADNGIEYFSYAAKIRNWVASDWGDGTVFFTLWALHGANDGFVTVDSQRLDTRGYPNFHHVETLAGSPFGRGYHHMFFSGRNDAIYAPPPGYRHAAPYEGTSADFYEQVAANLAAEGF